MKIDMIRRGTRLALFFSEIHGKRQHFAFSFSFSFNSIEYCVKVIWLKVIQDTIDFRLVNVQNK